MAVTYPDNAFFAHILGRCPVCGIQTYGYFVCGTCSGKLFRGAPFRLGPADMAQTIKTLWCKRIAGVLNNVRDA